MAKTTKQLVDLIANTIETAQLAGIESLIIEPKMIRGINEQKSAVLIETSNVISTLPAPTALTRLSAFMSRYTVAKTQDDLTIDLDIDTANQFVRSFTFNSSKLKVEYRCANPNQISAPKQVNDPSIYQVEMPAEAVVFLQKGQSAMGAENVLFAYDDTQVFFEMTDIGGDPFRYVFATDVQPMKKGGTIKPFAFKYPYKIIHTLLKHNVNPYIEFGQKGVLSIVANGLTFYILPAVG